MDRKKYTAFISYRHKPLDIKVAKKLQKMVESYNVPKDLREKWGSKKLGKLFRDETELPLSQNLTDDIYEALDNSEFLLVICTSHTRESKWITKEIEYFLKHHDRSRIIAVLAEGASQFSMPDILTHLTEEEIENGDDEIEPLAAKLAGTDRQFNMRLMKREVVRIYAAILGCEYDHLWQRERRAKTQRLLSIAVAALSISLLFLAFVWKNNVEINERNITIEAQNAEILSQNEIIEEKNNQLMKDEATALIGEAELLYQNDDIHGAIRNALNVLSSPVGEELYRPRAESLLYQALGAGIYTNDMRTTVKIKQTEIVTEMRLSADGSILYTMDDKAFMRSYSTETGDLLWESYSLYENSSGRTTRKRLYLFEELRIILNCSANGISALDTDLGEILWHIDLDSLKDPDFFCFSKDGKRLAYIKTEVLYTDQILLNYPKIYHVLIVDTKSGSLVEDIVLPDIYVGDNSLENKGNITGIMWDDKYIMAALYHTDDYGLFDKSLDIFLINTDDKNAELIRSISFNESFDDRFVIGVSRDPITNNLWLMHYNGEYNELNITETDINGNEIQTLKNKLVVPHELIGSVPVNYYANENGYIMASCGFTSLIYRPDPNVWEIQVLNYIGQIIDMSWIDEKSGTRSLYYDDGYVLNLYKDAGWSGRISTDKSDLVLLEKNDMHSEGSGFGSSRSVDSVQAVVCRNDKTSIYIQRPIQDYHMIPIESSLGAYTDALYIDDDKYIQYEVDYNNGFTFRIIDAESKNLIDQYSYTYEAGKELFSSGNGKDIFIWPGSEGYFTYIGHTGNGPCIYRFGFNSGEILFKEESFFSVISACKLNNGDVLQAAITNHDSFCALSWRTGLGEEHHILSKEGVTWGYTHSVLDTDYFFNNSDKRNSKVLVGGIGLIVFAETDNEDATTKIVVVNTNSEEQYTIPCSSNSEELIGVGDCSEYIVTVDNDLRLRIYDGNNSIPILTEKLPGYETRINSIDFFDEDSKLAILLSNRHLIILDLNNNEFLYDSYLPIYAIGMGVSDDEQQEIVVYEDKEHERIYLKYFASAFAYGRGICIDTKYWEKTSDIYNMIGYNAYQNELLVNRTYTVQIDGYDEYILYYPAYTLDDLKQWGEEYINQ